MWDTSTQILQEEVGIQVITFLHRIYHTTTAQCTFVPQRSHQYRNNDDHSFLTKQEEQTTSIKLDEDTQNRPIRYSLVAQQNAISLVYH